jgi:hypothetical protein
MTPKQNKMFPLLVNFLEDPRSFSEDFEHENGKYLNRCISCNELFLGLKRRVVCKLCSEPKVLQEILKDVD